MHAGKWPGKSVFIGPDIDASAQGAWGAVEILIQGSLQLLDGTDLGRLKQTTCLD